MRWFPAMCHAGLSDLQTVLLDGIKDKCPKPVLIVRIHWYFSINAVHELQNTNKYILGSHTRPLKFISAPLKAKHFIGQLRQLMTASNVGARTQAWQAKWAVFKIPGVCLQASSSFLPYSFPALSLTPFFARSLTLVSCSLLLNRTETLATQTIISL